MRLRRLLWLVPFLTLLVAGGAAWWLLATEAGLAWAWTRAAAALDGRLAAERVSGRLLGPLQAEGLRLERAGLRLEVATLRLDWQPGWLLAGRLALRDVTAQGVRLEQTDGAEGAAALPTAVVLPLALSMEGTVLRDLVWQAPRSEPLPIDEVRLDGNWRGTRLLLAPLTARGPWGDIRLDGTLASGSGRESDLAAQWALTLGEWALAGEGKVSGHFLEPRLTARFQAPFVVSIDGTLAWQESPPRWQAAFDLPELDLAGVRADWPALTLGGRGRLTGVGGEFSLEADGTVAEAQAGRWAYGGRAAYDAAGLRLERLALRPQGGSGELVLSGAWPGGAAAAQLAAQWAEFSHPVLPGWRSSGRLDAVGRPEDYRGRIAVSAVREGLPSGQVSTDFAGNLDGITLSTLAGQWLGGAWHGAATLAWHKGLDWRLRLGVADAEPRLLDARWPGRLSGEAEASGHWQDGWQVQIARLDLHSGRTRLSASGGVGAQWDVHWQLQAADLAELWPQAAGRLRLNGRVDGPAPAPRLRLDGEGQGLVWAEARLAQAGVHADVDLAGVAPWRLDLQLGGVEGGGQRLEAARLRARGSAARHDLSLEVRPAGGGSLEVAGQGSWAEGRWTGELRRGQIDLPRLGRWQAAPAPLTAGKDGGELQSWCWRGQGEVCIAAVAADGRWQATGALAGVPLALLEPWLPRSDLALSGHAGGALVAEGESAAMTALTVRLGVADGRLLYRLPDGAVESALRTLHLNVDGDAAGLTAELQAVAEDGGAAQVRLALPGWLPGQPLTDAQPVQGRLDLEADRLDWLTYLEPNLLRPQGRLQARLQLAGSLGEPALSGEFSLREGSVMLPVAGTHITALSLEGRSADGRTLTLSGTARSGPGQLTVSGVLASEHFGHWRAEVGLKGERFELVRLVQARALVSPDLQVVLEQGKVEVRGQLEVPQADINLPRLPTVVEVSPDEVILDAAVEEAALRRWRLLLDLRLVAGERVRLEGYGFSGRLAGAVTLRGETPGLTRAQGELNIHDGRYEAYGQNLLVERGRLLFVDSPPDNPGLDVRAVRPLPDPEQVVGVEVGGRLKDPRLRLFSVPVLEESEALAWLVLGRPLTATSRTEADALYRAAFALGGDRAARGVALQFGLDEVSLEQGRTSDEAAVVLGKYLSPRLYLQYAVGLWETANRWRLRYQLSSHWSLKMEQGGEQSGADLQYVIER